MILLNAMAVSTILKQGMIIRTKLNSSLTWYENIVYKIEANTVYISLKPSYIENIILPGMTMFLKYTNEYFEYLFEGIVSEIKPFNPGFITISVNKAEEMINTREFPRYEVYLASDITPCYSETSCFSIITNICLGGMAFLAKYQFDYGEETEVLIYLPNYETVKAKGKIIRRNHKTNYIDYSMQFIDMDECHSILLSKFVASLEDGWTKMRFEFDEYIKKLIL
jgi:hypothetical protein